MAKQYVRVKEMVGGRFTRREINQCACPKCGELLLPTPSGYVACIQLEHTKLLQMPPKHKGVMKLAKLLELPVATRTGEKSAVPMRLCVDGHDGEVFVNYRSKKHGKHPTGLVVARVKGEGGWYRRRLVKGTS